ncbi:macro domain-containing protein [Nocardia sp. NPDC059091]|uniref:macro domain-containing protein n=1 Tax=unclassified Nocardia TaxID=2637762 RepID=UPI0036B6EE2F
MRSATQDRPALLASCHHESLRMADELGADVVAFPAISTNQGGSAGEFRVCPDARQTSCATGSIPGRVTVDRS